MVPAPFTAYHTDALRTAHTPEHAGNLHMWDTLAADPAARAALTPDECLAWLMWNDPNGEWSEIADARSHVCDDDCRSNGCHCGAVEAGYLLTDDEIRASLESMMVNP